MHYVIAQAGHREGFGAVKLNKVLWFADARQYVTAGKPITGARYKREKYGPVPAAIMPVRSELQSEGKIKVFPQREAFEGTRFESLRPPEPVGFVGNEKQTVDYWIKTIATDHTAESISEESHDYAWEVARLGEDLPYHAYIATRIRPPTDEEMEWAREVARKRGRP